MVVGAAMVLLTVLGVATVFHEPIAALFLGAPPASEAATTAEERGAATAVARQR
jgi:hypothetical protein